MKADEDVKMIKPDALVLVVKSTELFIGQFIKDAYNYTKQEKRKTNLAERKTKNKNRAAKAKAARAGFEGKKSSFL